MEGFTNLGITYAGPGSGTGTIRLANTSDRTAYAYYPTRRLWRRRLFRRRRPLPTAGNYDWHTVMHELATRSG